LEFISEQLLIVNDTDDCIGVLQLIQRGHIPIIAEVKKLNWFGKFGAR
jgi:hypothetical protein